jgi:hypothetical protein
MFVDRLSNPIENDQKIFYFKQDLGVEGQIRVANQSGGESRQKFTAAANQASESGGGESRRRFCSGGAGCL